MKTLSAKLLCALLCAILLLALTGTPIQHARAASIVVNTAVDEKTTNGLCSLREAIANANNNAATHPDCATAFGIDTITFAGNYTITLDGAQLDTITSEIIINGKGAGKTIIQANASPNTATYRVFLVSDTGNLTLNGLTVRHGRCDGGCATFFVDGGGIYNNNGNLTITNSAISNNNGSFGGGIFNRNGNLTVTNSVFSGNSAGSGSGIYHIAYSNAPTVEISGSSFSENSASNGGGGGINNYNNNKGSVTVTNSSFSKNSAPYGGGVYNEINSTIAVTNSVISENTASASGGGIYNPNTSVLTMSNSVLFSNDAATGGGIYNSGSMWVANSTISGNEAYDYGGGIYSDGGAWIHNSTIVFNTLVEGTDLGAGGIDGNVALYNSIVVGNTRAIAGTYRDCTGSVQSWGVNLFHDTTNCTITVATGSWGYLNSLNSLGPLRDNGGPTWTHALLSGSNAIDTGDDALCAAWPVNGVDQRGITRPQGSHCDVGAYEAPVISTFRSTNIHDGWVLESTENSGVGGSLNSTAATFNLGDGAADKQYRAILSFNTSSLPDTAVIARVILKIRKQGLAGSDPFTILGALQVDIRKPRFGNSVTLANGDFQAPSSKNNIGSIPNNPVNNWYARTWPTDSFFSYLNLTGTTQFRLRFATDDNDDGAADYMRFFSGDSANPATRPQLIVEYYVP